MKKYKQVQDLRFQVPKGCKLSLKNNKNEFVVVDYSNTGFLLHCPKGTVTKNNELEINSLNMDNEELPTPSIILPLRLKTLWIETVDEKTEKAGFEIIGSNEMNKEFLCDFLREYLNEPDVASKKNSKTG